MQFNHSHGPTQTKHQVDQCVLGALWCMDEPQVNTDSQDSPQSGLGGSHHFPFYNILCAWPRDQHPNGIFVPGLPNGSFKILKVRIFATLRPHNFVCKPFIEMRSHAKLQRSSKYFQWYVARHLHVRKSRHILTFSGQESNYQFDFRPFFWP